jgi:hypothetical protein
MDEEKHRSLHVGTTRVSFRIEANLHMKSTDLEEAFVDVAGV